MYRGGGEVKVLSVRRGVFSDVSNYPDHILHSANHKAHINFSPKFKCNTTNMKFNFAKLTEI